MRAHSVGWPVAEAARARCLTVACLLLVSFCVFFSASGSVSGSLGAADSSARRRVLFADRRDERGVRHVRLGAGDTARAEGHYRGGYRRTCDPIQSASGAAVTGILSLAHAAPARQLAHVLAPQQAVPARATAGGDRTRIPDEGTAGSVGRMCQHRARAPRQHSAQDSQPLPRLVDIVPASLFGQDQPRVVWSSDCRGYGAR